MGDAHYITHKPIILLVEGPRKYVLDEVEIFMEDYIEYPFDYYYIGGRSSGLFTYHLLDPSKRDAVYQEFNEKHAWYVGGDITNETRSQQFNKIFYKHFPTFKGIPPQWRNANFDNIYDDDIIELEKVVPLVLKWLQDPIKEAEKYFAKAKKHREDPIEHKLWRNYAYSFKYQEINRDTNVYNITNEDYSFPANTHGWYAVIIDVHY